MAEDVPESRFRIVVELNFVVGVVPDDLRYSVENRGHSHFAIENKKGRFSVPPARSLSEKQCSKRYTSLVECKDANYSTTKSRLL